MAHSYVSSLHHCVFSTKERHPFLTKNVRDRLFPYLGGIARESGIATYSFNGVEDHVHLLIGMPGALPLSKGMQILKANSSKWIHETFAGLKGFRWQEGYGAFSIGVGQVETTIAYIQGQEERHKKQSFQEEYHNFLVKHGFKWSAEEALG